MKLQFKCELISILFSLAIIQASPVDSIRDWHILLNESFNADTLPLGWTINDGNNNGITWIINTVANRAEYSDSGYTPDEAIITPALAIPASVESLKIGYDYFFSLSYSIEFYSVNMRKYYGGSWGVWINLRNYMSDTSGRDLIDLRSFLPADSMQFDWAYRNIYGSLWSLCIVDSAMVRCFDLNKLNEDKDNIAKNKQPSFSITPSILKSDALIIYNISQPITGSLDLFDALGRKIMRIYKGKFSAGRHLCEIRKDLKPGIYFMILDMPETKVHQKLVLE